jgi:hypothetical protein
MLSECLPRHTCEKQLQYKTARLSTPHNGPGHTAVHPPPLPAPTARYTEPVFTTTRIIHKPDHRYAARNAHTAASTNVVPSCCEEHHAC